MDAEDPVERLMAEIPAEFHVEAALRHLQWAENQLKKDEIRIKAEHRGERRDDTLVGQGVLYAMVGMSAQNLRHILEARQQALQELQKRAPTPPLTGQN